MTDEKSGNDDDDGDDGDDIVRQEQGDGPLEQSVEDEEQQHEETEASFRRRFFEATEDAWGIAAPIAIRNLSVPRDGSNNKNGGSDLPRAPNFMTAIIGRWLSTKLGCMGPPPHTPTKHDDDDEATSSARNKYVVSNISAVLNCGEATLIIAPSSSGKTTLMRTIAKLCEGDQDVKTEGTLTIGNIDPKDPKYKGCFRRSTAMADQGDLTLTPVLKVDETIRFANMCANDASKEKLESNVSAYLRLAGLSHVAGTVVGDAEIRGVSGGQKRRVKVMEQAVGQDVRVLLLDEITNGLDSASALASCQNVAVAVEKTGITAMVSLLQPSTDMYKQFHRILVLTQNGEMAYSGPRDAALGHFQSLGLSKPDDMDEPEFLLRCTFKPSDFAEKTEESSTQSTPLKRLTSSDLPSLFANSPAGRALKQDLDTAKSTEPEKRPTVLRPFARPLWNQVTLLLGRGWKLVVRNPGSFIRVFFAIVFGLFVGTLFLNTPADEEGTATRTGYAYTMLLLLFMTAANSPMEANFADRGTFYCHRQANFYSSKAYYLSTIFCSWPVSFFESTFMAICSFFLVGMETYGGPGFLYFWLISVVVSFCGTSISRILSYSLPSNDVAAALGPALLLLFTMTAGFAPQYPDLPNWLRWLSWLSPCAYAFEGILVNELHTRTIAGTNVPGNEFGQEVFSIPRIPYDQARPAMATPGRLMAFDVYMLIAFTILFEICGCILLHASQKWYGPTTKRYKVTSGMSLTAGSGTDVIALLTGKKSLKVSNETGELSVPSAPQAHLTAKDIVYEVDVDVKSEPEAAKKADDKEEPKPESGAEANKVETSLVDSEERVLITAREYGQARKGAAQEWVLKRAIGEEALSLRTSDASSLAGSGKIRIDDLSAAEAGVVDDLEPPAPGRLRLLSGVTASFAPGTMTALMGSSGAGKTTLLDVLAGYKTGGHTTGNIALNGVPKTDETWRLVAGYCEQTDLHNPAITVAESLLFAARMRLRPFSLPDEARKAFCDENMKLLELEEYADILVGDEAAGQGLPKHARKRLTLGVELVANTSILFADEPTSGLDGLSASLVVSSLKRVATSRNVTVVCTIHQPSKEVFETFDYLLLLRKGGVVVYNGLVSGISEYMTSVSGNDAYALKAGTNPADHALDILCGPGGEAEDWGRLYRQSGMASDINETVNECVREPGTIDIKGEKRGMFFELGNVLQRQVLAHWRTPTYMAVRFWWTVSASLLTSLIFMDIPPTTDGAFNLLGAIFNFVNLATVPLMSAAVPLITERAVYYREVSSGTYRKYVYALAIELAEIPFNLLMAIVSWVIFYWLVGLDRRADRVIYNLLMTLLVYWVLPLFGQLFSFLSPNIGIASVMGGILLVAFTLTMGFLIRPDDIPPWWIWVYWINPLRYFLQGYAVNELGDGKEYLAEGIGAGDSPVYVTGDELLAELGGWSFSQRWWYCFVVVILFGFAASAGLLGATRINWMKR